MFYFVGTRQKTSQRASLVRGVLLEAKQLFGDVVDSRDAKLNVLKDIDPIESITSAEPFVCRSVFLCLFLFCLCSFVYVCCREWSAS